MESQKEPLHHDATLKESDSSFHSSDDNSSDNNDSDNEYELFENNSSDYSIWNLHNFYSLHKTTDTHLKMQKLGLVFLHIFMQFMILSIEFDIYEVDRQTELQLLFETVHNFYKKMKKREKIVNFLKILIF